MPIEDLKNEKIRLSTIYSLYVILWVLGVVTFVVIFIGYPFYFLLYFQITFDPNPNGLWNVIGLVFGMYSCVSGFFFADYWREIATKTLKIFFSPKESN